MNAPAYFQRVAASAEALWEKLKDPVLAGPWKQLFAQVQSPRHVLSELLQNADDAGAKTAAVRVEGNEFVFEHDGEDFNEGQFQSLCRFGYSNKRNLHTIGFRGVGFKSTFSLGERVRIQTPTLDVFFDRDRFTLPVWRGSFATATTRITVPFANKHCVAQLQKNLEEWATSPVSLLFFRNLQELRIGSQTVRKEIIGPGPIENSQRIRMAGLNTTELLLVRSSDEDFPDEVDSEIRQERNADELHLKSCSVEVILGLEGNQQLFVVLPAGTKMDVPFSINAPFLQDPARQKIKEPEVSPCNRWLLERAGKLAGEALAAWLANKELPLEDRAKAYRLLRGPLTDAADLTTAATKHVLDAMLETIEDEHILLTDSSGLAEIDQCTAVPSLLHSVWESARLKEIFLPNGRQLLSPLVARSACSALEAHGWITTVSTEAVFEAIIHRHSIPKPASWLKLELLWEWVQQNIGWDYSAERRRSMHIVPVSGQAHLQPAKEVIRVSSRGQQLSDQDWDFISNFAFAIDQDWVAHLGKSKSTGAEDESACAALLQALGLHEPSPVDRIAAQASRRLLARGKMPLADCIRIAHIFAALDAIVPDDFQYATEDLNLRAAKDGQIVFDPGGEVEVLLPKKWADEHLLHTDYVQEFASCSRDRWFAWAHSRKSKLHAFVPLIVHTKRFGYRSELGAFLALRNGDAPKEYRYKNDSFIADDFDFPVEVLQHWRTRAASNPKLWAAVARGLLLDPLRNWMNSLYVEIRQRSMQGSTSALNCGKVLPAWLIHLRSVPCLTDTHGNLRMPQELLLRMPETESQLGIDLFVAAELDDSAEKKRLLRLLGVRDTATDWTKVVERLRGISRAKDPMRFMADVLRLYDALDRISLRCSGDDLAELRTAFASESLILSNSLDWLSSGELSLHADPEDNSPVVHSALQSLGLWLRLNVPERPALEKSLEWLKTVPTGTRLDGASFNRAKLALTRGGRRVWEELGHWLSLDQTWEVVGTLKYRVSMQRLTRWEKLALEIKRLAADLRMLGSVGDDPPFTATQPLADVVTMQVTQVEPIPGRPRRIEWLKPLGDGLSRVKLADEPITAKVRTVARRLLDTNFQTIKSLEVTPYIDGAPAGEPLTPKVLWSETTLYIANQSTATLYRELKDEISRPFGEPSVMDAVAHCIDRDADFVVEYLATNFELEVQAELQPSQAQPGPDPAADSPAQSASKEGRPELEKSEEPANGSEAGDDTGVEFPQDENASATSEKSETQVKPKEPSFMDRYARGRGFRWREDERCYTHANGGWIEKGEAPFNWHEHADGTGVTKRLFVVEKSLSTGVEIPSELWRLMENPYSIALVLCTNDGEPKEWSASELKALHSAGQLRLHQSQFILRQL